MNLFTDEILQFIFDNHNGISYTKMTEIVNEKFNSKFSVNQVHYQYMKYKLNSGLTGRFNAGNIPWNKGKNINTWNLSDEKQHNMSIGRYSKGHIPWTVLPIGSERIKQGFVYVKVDHPNKWKRKQIAVWEKHNGSVPKGYCVIFIDGDRSNFNLDNLALISKEENLRLNENHWRFTDSELQKAALNVVRLNIKLGEFNESNTEKFE